MGRVILEPMRLRRRDFIRGSAAGTVALAARHGFSFAKRYNDDVLLDDLAHRSCQYFWDASDPESGICRDLIHSEPADNEKKKDEARGSTGVSGFCLTALCIAAERGWIRRDEARDRVRRALRSYTSGKVLATNGWFYHFIDIHTGQRWGNSEVPTSDSIWLLAGALTCRGYFHEDHEIRELTTLFTAATTFLAGPMATETGQGFTFLFPVF